MNAALEQKRPSPIGFERITVAELVSRFLDYCENVHRLAPRTVERYKAALSHFVSFAKSCPGLRSAEQLTSGMVEDFVRCMRGAGRARNGSPVGRKSCYTDSGVEFILSVCRTLFNYAAKRRYLPPYTENPFSSFPMGNGRHKQSSNGGIPSKAEMRDLFEACDDWQLGIFLTLWCCGLRVGELTHLLISDLDFDNRVFHIRSKPEMFWHVKTRPHRAIPMADVIHDLFKRLVANRKVGFVFLNEPFCTGARGPALQFSTASELVRHLQQLAEKARENGARREPELRRAIVPFLREMGQIPEKRVRQELMKLTRKIGCPEVTRAHDLRHAFTTTAQECGANPMVVRDILGHTTLEMTSRYTHMSIEAGRAAVASVLESDASISSLVRQRIGRQE